MDKKRIIPRHVDEKIRIFRLSILGFSFMLIPILISLILFVQLNNPIILVLDFFICAVPYVLLIELSSKESGFSMLRSFIKHSVEGTRYYQRHCLQIDEDKRNLNRRIEE